ncbi:MAG: DUF6263 family protein [Planctomycetota bacterium]|nr:DUF6263 family protein [Planctomycetota bacterium]
MKDKRFQLAALAAALVGVVVVVADGEEKVQYSLKLEKGNKYYIQMITEQQISQTVMGQEQNVERTMGMGMNFDVNDVNESGSALVRYTYTWVKLGLKGPMGEAVYDSSQKDALVPPMAQSFAGLVGEGFSVKLTRQGKVEQVRDLDKIYPDRPVGVGDSWNKTIVLSVGFPMIMENKWTLKEHKDGVATIELDSTIKPDPNAKPMEMGQMKMSYELSGRQQGLIRMRESTGQLISSKMEQQLSGQVKTQSAGLQPQEMVVPMKIKGVVTMEMTERKEGQNR